MKEKSKIIKYIIIGIAIIAIIIFTILYDDIKELNDTKHKTELIQQGKIESSYSIINEIIQVLKEKDSSKLDEYLNDDIEYWKDDKEKNINSFLQDIDKIEDNNWKIEQRNNSIDNQETYLIYWNTNKDIINIECSQKITFILEEVVKSDTITYEIKKIILINN